MIVDSIIIIDHSDSSQVKLAKGKIRIRPKAGERSMRVWASDVGMVSNAADALNGYGRKTPLRAPLQHRGVQWKYFCVMRSSEEWLSFEPGRVHGLELFGQPLLAD